MSAEAHAAVDCGLRAGTVAGLPGSGSVCYDYANAAVAYITCVGNGAFPAATPAGLVP